MVFCWSATTFLEARKNFQARFLSFRRLREDGNRKFEVRDPVGVEHFNLWFPASSSLQKLKNQDSEIF